MPPIQQFAALADETRCRVLELLYDRPRPVHELAAEFAISRPAISRHLRVLKEAGLVREEKRGREHVYAFQPAELLPAGEWLAAFPVTAAVAEEPSLPATLPPIAERAPAPKPKLRRKPAPPPATLDLFDFAS